MNSAIIASLITGGFTFAGVVVTSLLTNSSNRQKVINEVKTENAKAINEIKEENTKVINDFKLEVTKNQAVTDTKIGELTREVREHNNFAKRMPAVEKGIESLEEKVNYFHKV